MSLQKRFAIGLLDGLIVHLKFKGLWDLYKLTRSKLDVIFTPPVEWQVYRRKNLLNAKLEMVKLFVGEESVSKLFSEEYALTHFMGWNKNQIEQNAIQRFQEQIRHAKEEALLEKVKSGGTIDFKDENLGFDDTLKNILLKDIIVSDEESSETTDDSADADDISFDDAELDFDSEETDEAAADEIEL
jgi:hypothetical protein